MADTTYQNVTTQNNLPDWYVQYLTPILQQAQSQSQSAYQPYTGPLVAGMTQDQLDAYKHVENGIGNQYGMYLDPATQMAQQAGNVNSGAAAAGQYGQAQDIYGGVAGSNTSGISQPYVNSGTDYLKQAAQGSALSQANPYIAASVAPQGLAAASPYLSAASGSFTGGNVDDYMSPYTQQVTDRIAQLGQRNLQENLLPSISDQFVRSGQYGSPQQRNVISRALRDTQESVLGQQAQALESGYQTAGNLYESDSARQAQLAGTAGGLGTSQQQILQGAGSTLGNLSATDLSRLAAAGVNIGNLGISQAGVAGSDLSRQLSAAQGIQGIGQSLINSTQNDAATKLASANTLNTLANTGVDTGLRQAAALESAGAAQQGQTQANYNTAYNQFLQQQQYPWTQIGNASNVIQGLPVNTSSSTAGQTTTPSPSVGSQIGGIGLGIAGLANSGIFKARGGRVRKTAHSYGKTPRRGISLALAA